MNVFLKADAIINQRSEEKDRQYGPIDQSMTNTAIISSILCNKEITQEDVYKIMTALKLARLGISYKEDSILDAIAYLGAYNNFKTTTTMKTQINLDSAAMANELLNLYHFTIDKFVNRQFKIDYKLAQRILIGNYGIIFYVDDMKRLSAEYENLPENDLTVYYILAEHLRNLICKRHNL